MEEEDEYPKVRGVTRLKYEHTSQGWWARYTRDGVTLGQVFRDNDPKYGSKRAAWEAAKAWHEEARRILPPRNRREYANMKRANNSSGHTGVYRSFRRNKSGKRYYWAAFWSPKKGEHKHAYFYEDEVGAEQAKAAAVEKRKEEIQNIQEEWDEDYWNYRGHDDELSKTFFFDVFGFEGAEKYETHKLLERDPKLRRRKLEAFLEQHGKLFCELCNFDFEKEYGEIGKGLIEVHHTVPLAEMDPNHRTTIEELICVCSNCHFTIHNGDHVENLRRIRFIFSARQAQR